MPRKRTALAAATAVAVTLLSATGAASAATVTPNAPAGWQYQERNNGQVRFSPDGLRLTTGAELTSPSTVDPAYQVGGKAFAYRPEFAGQALSSLTSLSYRSFIDAGSGAGPNFTVGINVPLEDPVTHAWLTNLVFEPYYSQTPTSVARGIWQSWNAATDARSWWSTTDLNGNTCPASGCYTTLAAWKAKYPDAIIGHAGLREGNTPAGQPVNPGISFVVGQRGTPSTWNHFIGFLNDVEINGTSWDFTTGTGAAASINTDTLAGSGFQIVSDDGSTPVVGGNATNQRGIVDGPANPIAGTLSYWMQTATLPVPAPRAREGLYYTAAAGRTVGDLTDLSYWSYEPTSNTQDFAPYLTIGVNDPSIPTSANYTGLGYDPGIANNSASHPVVKGSWQKWEPFAPDARWRCTRTFAIGSWTCNNAVNGTTTWAEIQDHLGSAVINADGIQFGTGSTGNGVAGAGTAYDGVQVYLSGLTIGMGGAATTFGFDAVPAPPAPPAPPTPTPTPTEPETVPVPEPQPVEPAPAPTPTPTQATSASAEPSAPTAAEKRQAAADVKDTLGRGTSVTYTTEIGGALVFSVKDAEPTRNGTPVLALKLDEGSKVDAEAPKLKVGGKTITPSVTTTVKKDGTAVISVELTASQRTALRKAGKTKLTVTVTVTDASGNEVEKKVTVKLPKAAKKSSKQG